ncbi:MAG TPA: hypothetical protein VK327_11760, partial [Candidatus Paceibacterota bacterium]|nr:hypothetical protein [Candidatus Paceibacterota bacterium]
MSDYFEPDPDFIQAGPKKNGPSRPPHNEQNGEGHTKTNGHSPGSGFDAWTVADVLVHRWHWLVIGGILGCAAFFLLGWLKLIQPKFTATVQLLRYETPTASESLRGTPLSAETFAGLIASPDLLRRVGEKVVPPIPPERLIKLMKVDPQPESDIVKVYIAARDPRQAVQLANLYADEAVAYTKELQAKQAA